ncbi:calponin [Metarhizium album ARSEF 1941]|uniref:Calponin n=1 Tax=Metarhizium album (strain ARSEF 1941) TaxID=1081103 RepID=A0A0B2WJR5_METAS|nr:calponin [Metarhizium album ARSEF 1941]KHN96241.1 calponin [Metarhizium album ARSEF 1941]
MASVTSLDKDLRKMRLDKYTPEAAKEARSWVEEALGEKLPSSDLLEGLKDGVALCKLVNLATPPPGIRFKKSSMPFVQMENISHFLRACQSPPLSLHQHDTFLTVDLYEQKDPAQVLQCLGAFSRAAHDANPGRFPDPIGPKPRAAGLISPQVSGYAPQTGLRGRGASVTSNSSSAYSSKPVLPRRADGDTTPTGRRSPTKSPTFANPAASPGPVSSWSKREHEGSTAPAWNIAQYGYMGGASQGNLGISFGGLRQITSAGPHVPSLADKERRRREDAERQEEEERQRRAQQEAREEEEARREEERRWEAEAQRLREEERRKAAEEKRRWEEQERQWRLTEEKRRREEEEAEARLEEERKRAKSRGDARLQGQSLTQHQAEQAAADGGNSRSQKLEEQLARARQREAEYERERQTRSASRPVGDVVPDKARSRSRNRGTSSPPSPSTPSTPSAVGPQRPQNRYESWTKDDERDYLHNQWSQHRQDSGGPTVEARRAESVGAEATPSLASAPRPLPDPNVTPKPRPPLDKSPISSRSGSSSRRPLPDPKTYAAPASASSPRNRTDLSPASNAPPQQAKPRPTYSRELGATEERDGEDRRRAQSQTQTGAAGRASKSLLEREMELERQRQREWEEAQRETASAVRSGDGVEGIGGGIGGRWDLGQWSGYTGGDSQNRGSQGIGSGRRQIVGPRPLPGPGR